MRTHRPHRDERGLSLLELMVALVVLSIGLITVSALFPAGSRGQTQDRLMTSANFYAQQKLEELNNLTWSDPALAVGRHPTGTAFESVGPDGNFERTYEVTAMAAPLDNLKKVVVTVQYTAITSHSVTATTYVRR